MVESNRGNKTGGYQSTWGGVSDFMGGGGGGGSSTGGSPGSSGPGGSDSMGSFAKGGRVGYQAGGVATPEQYAAALAKVGGGTEADKRRSLGNYLGNYISTQGQKLGNAAVIPLQAAKGVLGIQGTPMTQSMQTSLQNIIQNQIKNTGQLSGNINYNDYGVKTTTGAEFEGFGNRSITDPESALATTLGQASYSVDPGTGKVNFTGGTAYDFRDDQFGGLGKFISKGGVFNQLPSPSNNFKSGATEYNPNISLSSDFLKPYQTTQNTSQTTQNTSQKNYGSPGSIYTDSGNTYYVGKDGLPYNVTGINLENFKVQGENPDGSFYTKYNIPSSVYGLANGGLATMFSEKR